MDYYLYRKDNGMVINKGNDLAAKNLVGVSYTIVLLLLLYVNFVLSGQSEIVFLLSAS